MVEINWTHQAIDDVDAIAEYLSRNSSRYARAFIEKVFERSQQLKTLPNSGRMVPELERKDIRELIMKNYRIIYRLVSSNRIDILTVHNSARPLPRSVMFE